MEDQHSDAVESSNDARRPNRRQPVGSLVWLLLAFPEPEQPEGNELVRRNFPSRPVLSSRIAGWQKNQFQQILIGPIVRDCDCEVTMIRRSVIDFEVVCSRRVCIINADCRSRFVFRTMNFNSL